MFSTTAKVGVAAVFSLSLVAAGCQNPQTGQAVGTGLGAAGGGTAGYFIGQSIGGTTGGVVGAILGAVAGGAIGGEIGRRLSEPDQQQAATATATALNNADQGQPPAPVQWTSSSGTGTSGQATVVKKPQTASADCYDVREVAYIPGQGEVEQTTRYCKGEQGWVVA